MKLFVVSYVTTGYDNRSTGPSKAIGAFRKEHVARQVALLFSGAHVSEIEVDVIPKGIQERAKSLGITLNAN